MIETYEKMMYLIQSMYPRLICQAKMNSVAGLQIARANDGNFYLVNRGNSNITISAPTELFGFNVGSYVEVPSDPIQGVRRSIMKQQPVKLSQCYLTHKPIHKPNPVHVLIKCTSHSRRCHARPPAVGGAQ